MKFDYKFQADMAFAKVNLELQYARLCGFIGKAEREILVDKIIKSFPTGIAPERQNDAYLYLLKHGYIVEEGRGWFSAGIAYPTWKLVEKLVVYFKSQREERSAQA